MEQLTNIFKLLSDETRLRIILLLFQEELCVCQLSGILEAPQPRVSKNLAKLRDMNLVDDRRSEKYIYYTLKRENAVLMQTLQDITDHLALYPQLIADQNRLGGKENYLDSCCVPGQGGAGSAANA